MFSTRPSTRGNDDSTDVFSTLIPPPTQDTESTSATSWRMGTSTTGIKDHLPIMCSPAFLPYRHRPSYSQSNIDCRIQRALLRLLGARALLPLLEEWALLPLAWKTNRPTCVSLPPLLTIIVLPIHRLDRLHILGHGHFCHFLGYGHFCHFP